MSGEDMPKRSYRSVRIVLPPSENGRPRVGANTCVYDAESGRDISKTVSRVTVDIEPHKYPVAVVEVLSPELDLTLDAEFVSVSAEVLQALHRYEAVLEIIVAECRQTPVDVEEIGRRASQALADGR